MGYWRVKLSIHKVVKYILNKNNKTSIRKLSILYLATHLVALKSFKTQQTILV